MNRPEERPDDGRKTVLIVEDDPGTQRVLASGLATTLGMFDVLTANHGKEAVELLDSRPIDVVVTDLAMPIMDGFALIGYLTNLGTTMPVVVLSALAPTTVAEGLDGYGGLTVLRKPASYQEVARAVLEALERHALGQVAGIPLASVLQLVEAERRTCSLGVTSGRRRGRLHFESGRLINAFSDDFGAEGEAAAYDILTWSRTAIEFDRLPDGVRRTIDVPTQTLLIEVARRQDAQREQDAKRTPALPLPRAANAAPAQAVAVLTPTPDERSDAEPEAASGTSEHLDDANRAIAGMPDPALLAHAGPPVDSAAPLEAIADRADAEAPSLAPVFEADLASESGVEPATEPTSDLGPEATFEPASEPGVEPAIEPPSETEPEAAFEPASGSTPEPEPASEPEWAPEGDRDAAREIAAPEPDPRAPAPDATPAPSAPTEPHTELLAAIERLTHRVEEADAALAAVADEVASFHGAQQRYDASVRRQEERRRAVEAARRDVADLARQILARMDGLFEAADAELPAPSGEPRAADAPPNA